MITLEHHVVFRYNLLPLDENRIFGRLKSNSWRTVAQKGKNCKSLVLRDSNHSNLACWSCSQSYPLSPTFILGAFAILANCLLKYPLPPARPSGCIRGTMPEPWNGYFWILILGAFCLYTPDIFILDVQLWLLRIRYCIIRQSHAFRSCFVFRLWEFF